jgi:hypothetical protein
VHQHLEELIEQVVDRFIPELELALVGDELLELANLRGRQASRCRHVARLGADLFLVADVLVKDRLDVELDFFGSRAIDIFAAHQGVDHLGGNLGNLCGVNAHARVTSASLGKNRGFCGARWGYFDAFFESSRAQSSLSELTACF